MTLDKHGEIASEVLKRMARDNSARATTLIYQVATERRYTMTRKDKNVILEIIQLVIAALPAGA